MAEYQLVDPQGRPVRKSDLTTELAGATIGGVRSPITGYPADGLNPMSLAGILRDADAGNALRYLELAETIEERDAREVTHVRGRGEDGTLLDVEVVNPGSPVANPGFDVTPARLVTGIITERGITPATADGLLSLYPERRAAG